MCFVSSHFTLPTTLQGGTGYTVCGAQCKMKIWSLCARLRNSRQQEQSTDRVQGPVQLHESHPQEASCPDRRSRGINCQWTAAPTMRPLSSPRTVGPISMTFFSLLCPPSCSNTDLGVTTYHALICLLLHQQSYKAHVTDSIYK